MHVLPKILLPLLGLSICHAYRYLGISPLSSWSHFNIFDSLIKGLIDKGHQVDVISHFPQKKPYPNYTNIVNIELYKLTNNMTYEFISKIINTDVVKIIALRYGNQICQIYLQHPVIQKLVRDPPKDPPYDAVIMEV
jgi:glucuronosyltransferase